MADSRKENILHTLDRVVLLFAEASPEERERCLKIFGMLADDMGENDGSTRSFQENYEWRQKNRNRVSAMRRYVEDQMEDLWKTQN